MYQLGEFVRKKYNDFLGPNYRKKEVYSISTAVPRTQMSLQLVLASLFPTSNSKYQRWNKNINWQPVPMKYPPFQKLQIFQNDKCTEYVKNILKFKRFYEY